MRRLLAALVLLLLAGPADARWPIPVGGAASSSPPFSTTSYHAFGDSITYGEGASSPSLGYVGLITADKSLTNANYGTSGVLSSYINSGEIFPNENPVSGVGNPIYTILAGTNDVWQKGLGSWEATYINNLEAGASWLAAGTASKVAASACTLSSGWSAAASLPTGSMATTTIGSTASCSMTPVNGVLYAWYKTSGLSYSLDGGATTPVTVLDTSTVSLIRLTGLSAGSHTLVITDTSGATSLVGIGTPPSSHTCCRVLLGGVIREQSDNNGVASAGYDADAGIAGEAMTADGLNISFVPVRNYVNDSTDMYDNLHPNDSGHSHLRDAFEANWLSSYTGLGDVVAAAEGWSLTRKITASYSGSAFQLYAIAGPNVGATHDVGFGSNGSVDTTGVVGSGAFCSTSAANCVYSKIYAQIHPGSNDLVPVDFNGDNGPACGTAGGGNQCACVYEVNPTTGLPQMTTSLPAPLSGLTCQYALPADGTATGILGTPANDIAGIVVGRMWGTGVTDRGGENVVLDISHAGTGGYTYGTLFSIGYAASNTYNYEDCTDFTIYCLGIDLEQPPSTPGTTCNINPCGGPYTGDSSTSTVPGNLISQASYNHTTGLMSGYSNGHQAWTPQTVLVGCCTFAVPTPPHIHFGAGGDMTPQRYIFFEGLVTNVDITSNAAAVAANVRGSPAYSGLTFP